jgi:hypothetical protein
VKGQLFEELRPVGFAVAYRMLGSVSEAEDIVQEAFLRLHQTLQDGERMESPRGCLARVVTRLATFGMSDCACSVGRISPRVHRKRPIQVPGPRRPRAAMGRGRL